MKSFSHGADLTPPPDRVDPVLDALNMLARAAYRRRLDDAQESLARIMVLDLYSLTLIERSSSETVSIAPPLYTLLKDLGHSCLGVYSVVIPFLRAGAPPSRREGQREELLALTDHLRQSRERFEQAEIEPEARALSRAIFALNEDLLLRAASGDSLEEPHLEAWGRELGPRLERAFRLAARAQVDAIHTAVTGWAAARGDNPWRHLWVIPMGPRVAREGFLQTQYFERLLGPDGARERLIFGENISEIPEALRLLTAVVLDRSLSQTLFGDRLRLEMDILAFGARERLDELFGSSPHAWPSRGGGEDENGERRSRPMTTPIQNEG